MILQNTVLSKGPTQWTALLCLPFLPFNLFFLQIYVSSPLRDQKVISLSTPHPFYLFEEQMNFPCKPPCSLFSNRCLRVCVASWVINPGFHSTKFGCSRFSSALSWDLSACTQHWGASLSIFDNYQPQEIIWYENDMAHCKSSPLTVS